MKSLITLILLLSLATSASAQDVFNPYAKGTKLAGFSLNGFSRNTETNGIKSELGAAVLNAQFGYFVINGLAVGIDLNSTVSTIEMSSSFGNSTDETTQATFGLFAAYYFRLNAKSAIYPEIRVFSGNSETVYDDSLGNDGKDERKTSGSTIGLGYLYRINQNIGLDVKLRGGREKTLASSTDGGDDLEFDWSTGQFLVGFQILF